MRIRHRVPSIFNLSMVDVLCCALGCVILLWLLNLRAARQKADEASQTDQRLTETTKLLTATREERDDLRRQLATATVQLTTLTSQAEKLQTDLGGSGRQLAETRKQLQAAEEKLRDTTAALTKTEGEREQARTTSAELEKALAALRGEKKDVEASLNALRADKQLVEGRLARQAQDYKDLDKKLAASVQQVAALEESLTALRSEKKDVEDSLNALKTARKLVEEKLARQLQDYNDLDKKLAGSVQQVTTLEGQLREQEGQVAAGKRRNDDLTSQLSAAEARLRKIQPLADLVPDLQEDVKSYREKFATEEALSKGLEKELGERIRELALANKGLKDLQAARDVLEKELGARDKELTTREKDLSAVTRKVKELQALRESLEEDLAGRDKDLSTREKDLIARGRELREARARVAELEDEKKALRGAADRLRQAADNRFAGIALTGRRVVFLVDMSGSMELVDEQTPAPGKWQGVRETLAKVLRSLPNLEQYQVILFAEKPTFLLGQEGRWIDYDPDTSPRRVMEALENVKPKGGTNMYSAFETVFRYRQQGLDTVYLLSDGLPNLGEPLTAEQMRTLPETQQGEILGRHIRRTLKNNWNRPLEGQPQVRINAIGFFFESPDVGAFLWALTRENDGSFVGMSKP